MRGPTRLGTGFRGDAVAAIDLGTEPPLMIGGTTDDEGPVHRAVSFRWLAGTILTGFTSIFLMGGALMAALNNPNQFAALPDAVAGGTLAASAAVSGIVFGQKSDRIQPLEEEVASRQVLQVSTVTKQGERDFIKLRPFAKINATLASRKTDHADEIPAYDALRIFADDSAPEVPVAAAASEADDQIYGADVDGEVSVKVSDFSVELASLDTGVGFDTPEVEAIVRASATFSTDNTHVAALPYVDPTRFTDELADEDPFTALGVRIIPENVSNVAKSNGALGAESAQEKVVAVARGQSFRDLLEENDVSGADADHIIDGLSDLVDLNRLHVGHKVRLAYAADYNESERPIPVRVSVYDDGAHQATVARADNNAFVRADEPTLEPGEFANAEAQPEEDFGAMPRVYDAVYETALEQEVPKPLIDQMIRIFAFNVDFQARITPGDAIDIFHSMPEDGPDASDPEILYASLTLSGVPKRFYRFRTSDDGVVDYYDEEGKSAKKFLMRKPMTTGILRSGFGRRVHPILGYARMHTGVDFAAPRGTPILAAGNGTVEKAGRNSGYGNMIVLKHTNGYETVYGHQQAFAKGMAPGVKVRQGQIIGYVGSTGLSTGPHLHFEIRVNGSPVDPLRIRLPRGRVLEGDLLVAFENERHRIDNLLGTSQTSTKVASAAPAD